MAPPVYEPDEAGEAPTARLGKRLGEDSQTQRHDSVSSVGERNVLAATSAGRVEMGKSGGTGLLVGRSNSSQAGGLSLGFANEPSVFARGSEPSTTQAQQPASVANHHASPQYFGGHGGARQSNSSRTTWSLADFRVGERVGASRLSAVYHAMHKSTGMDIALKCYLRDRLDAFSLAQIKREVSIHAKLAHPAVVPFYGSFEDERGNIYLLHEYARGGDVFSLLNKSGGAFSEAQTCGQILHPVASAVAYLHARGHHAPGYQTRELTRGRLQRGGQGDGLWVRHGFHPEPVQDPAGHHGLHGAGDCAVRQGDEGQAPRGEQERVRPRG